MIAAARTLTLALALAACASGEGATREEDARVAAARGTLDARAQAAQQEAEQVDALRRFQSPIEPVKALAGGQPSAEALAREVIRALSASDTAALQQVWVSRAEWAYLYFPTSIFMQPEYRMPPDVQWQLSLAGSEKGVLRLLRRMGGEVLAYEGVSCTLEPEVQGENRIWRDCRVRFARAGEPESEMVLYKGVLEHDGVFKVLSYGNEF